MITYFSDLLHIKDTIIIHPIQFFENAQSFLLTITLDTVLLLFFLLSGLLLNVVFYRLGTLGGYSFIGLLALIPIVMVIFEWYLPLYNLLSEASVYVLLSSLLGISILLYTVITSAMYKASANPA